MKRATDLPFVIKVCGITNEEDARVAIEAGANALGFNFYEKSPRFVTANRAREIIAAVQGDYLKVGIFVNPTAEEVIDACDVAGLNIAQVHGEGQPEITGRMVWRAVPAGEAKPEASADAYLFDTPADVFGGSGQVFDWRLAAGRSYRVIIAGGLDGANVAEAIATALPWGVDACSRLESKPGKKDARKVLDFVNAAREAFRVHMRQEITL